MILRNFFVQFIYSSSLKQWLGRSYFVHAPWLFVRVYSLVMDAVVLYGFNLALWNLLSE
jgi:hypothetical protein